jgi:hypothetical protein
VCLASQDLSDGGNGFRAIAYGHVLAPALLENALGQQRIDLIVLGQ